MKALFRFALAAALPFALAPARAQTIANLDFETWSNRTTAVAAGVEAPANWQTFDDVLSAVVGVALPVSSSTVTKSTDAHGGSYAARLETKTFALLGATVPGAMALGSRYIDFGSLYSGVPYTSRPTQMQFYYKLTGPGAATDRPGVSVSLTRTTGGVSTDIVLAFLPLAPAATYTLATVPLTYLSAATPDSVHIEFYSAGGQNPLPGTVLLVDDVAFATPTATRAGLPEAPVSVAPNPSADGRFVLNSSEPALLAAPFTVTDMTGRVVLQVPAGSPATSRALDLGSQAAGLYTLQLQTERGVVVRKLLVVH
ncbi:T9SS type A sorting domain-containing protein [Hymenobacter convexus]|uniref:T9SS type A sorting domain-containing protein n=1 Tax=Hymenobacter sp. CA1UV-4 TaxID=3063782 RepID=UPI002713D202|nr:T9SS type A sorting domain-containing protein [Hymenobacter sp. CA1UV-4]MDO7851349.1 T9SS type A sorting domain-containing protein [Hymenobacter sp. CA1UV-4]